MSEFIDAILTLKSNFEFLHLTPKFLHTIYRCSSSSYISNQKPFWEVTQDILKLLIVVIFGLLETRETAQKLFGIKVQKKQSYSSVKFKFWSMSLCNCVFRLCRLGSRRWQVLEKAPFLCNSTTMHVWKHGFSLNLPKKWLCYSIWLWTGVTEVGVFLSASLHGWL